MLNQILKPQWAIYVVVAIGLVIRMSLAFGFEGTGDTGGWRLAGITGTENKQVGIGNGNPFDGDCPLTCFNWPPLTYRYFVATRLAYLHANPFNLPDRGYYKLLPFLADSATIFMIYRFLKNRPNTSRYLKPITAASLYAFHPLAWHIAGYHGQRDTIWILTTFIAIELLEHGKKYWSAIIFALGVAIKIPVLYFAPLMTLQQKQWNKRIIYASLIVLTFIAANLPEIATQTQNVITQVFLYPGLPGFWGIQGIINRFNLLTGGAINMAGINTINKIVMLGSVIIGSFYIVRKTRQIELQLIFMTMIVFVTSNIFASQYLLWPIPFMLVLEKKYQKYTLIYSLLAVYMAMNFYGFFGINFIEQNLITIIQPFFYQRVPYLSYPWDLGFFVWIFAIIFIKKLVKDLSHATKT